jgi:hypothetical protein
MKIAGYEIAKSNGRGGKAGRDQNKTATIQVRDTTWMDGGYVLCKQFRFIVGSAESEKAALKKARDWVLNHL